MRIERPDREPDLEFQALGVAKPAGSKDTGVCYRTDKLTGAKIPVVKDNGSIATFVRDQSGEKGKHWRSAVAAAGYAAIYSVGRFDGPLYVELTIVRPRGPGHYGRGKNAGKLLPSAPNYPAVMPDVIKLTRAIEDALNGVVWGDDSRNIVVHSEKVYAEEGESPGVIVRLWTLPATVGYVVSAEQLALDDVAA